ncbi:MAG: hypothetical protein DYG89_41400 [Caldilinea sp. CFX5]|nr:hypothetical protein [Caldilinea sp. CFX5]
MFHQRLNELRLVIQLKPQAPLLIKAGDDPGAWSAYDADKTAAEEWAKPFGVVVTELQQALRGRADSERAVRAAHKAQLVAATGDQRKGREKLELDMRFVRTRRNGRDEPYLPGASLKGVLRSRAEQLVRTFLPAQRVCDIFAEPITDSAVRSCTKTIEGVAAGLRYAQACRICQLFGCGGLAGRVQVSDAYLAPNTTFSFGQRSGVGINRQRGAAQAKALFFYEVLEQGLFQTTITLENFELWQVGLLAHPFHELWTGQLPVGYGAQRGLGRLTGSVQQATLTYFGLNRAAGSDGCVLHGVGALNRDVALRERYQWVAEPAAETILPDVTKRVEGLRCAWTLGATAQERLWQAGAQALGELMLHPAHDRQATATKQEGMP